MYRLLFVSSCVRAGILIVALLATAAIPSAENWPQWRGPSLNGLSGEKNLPAKWSAKENVTWKLQLPAWSGSTPIVWGNRIFLNVAEDLSVRDGNNLSLWSIDRANATVPIRLMVNMKRLSAGPRWPNAS